MGGDIHVGDVSPALTCSLVDRDAFYRVLLPVLLRGCQVFLIASELLANVWRVP